MAKYVRGNFLLRAAKERVDKLINQDDKAREIYTGLEEQTERLKKIIEALRERKHNGSDPNQNYAKGFDTPGVHS